ncbi:hypothetical protein DYH09_34165 [bacterium CPR1]|nr:hypothetical protein [bacterium CPR1]
MANFSLAPVVELSAAAKRTILELPNVTQVREQLADSEGIDVVFEVVRGKDRVILPVQIKSQGYPRDVAEAARRLVKYRDEHKTNRRPIVPLLIAPSLSPGSRKLLQELGVGYWDSGGSLYLQLPDAVYLLDRPVPPVERRRTRGLFRGSSAQVLHQLLLEPERAWHGNELAERSGVSTYTVHQVLGYLEEQLWVEREGKGPHTLRYLRNPGGLLDAWSEVHSLDDYVSHPLHVLAASPDERDRLVLEFLESHSMVYALTLEAGALRVAPYVTGFGVLSVLVSADVAWERSLKGTRLRPVSEGANVIFWAQRRGLAPLMGRREVDGVWVASDVQLYLDLWSWPRRGKEQAEHLRRERLGY